MNNVLLRKINKKSDKYSKLLKIPKTDASYVTKKAEFNEYVKDVKNDIKIAKRNHYFHVFNMHKNNMKQTWRTITKTLNKQVNSREIPTKIILNDETVTDNVTKKLQTASIRILQTLAFNCPLPSKSQIEYHHLKRTWVMIMLIQI